MKNKYSLVKQLAYRRPKRIKTVVCFANSSLEKFAVCPTCGHLLDREYMGFCDVCGQNLSWRNFDCAKVIYK